MNSKIKSIEKNLAAMKATYEKSSTPENVRSSLKVAIETASKKLAELMEAEAAKPHRKRKAEKPAKAAKVVKPKKVKVHRPEKTTKPTLSTLESDIATIQAQVDNPNTPEEIKAKLRPALEKAKEDLRVELEKKEKQVQIKGLKVSAAMKKAEKFIKTEKGKTKKAHKPKRGSKVSKAKSLIKHLGQSKLGKERDAVRKALKPGQRISHKGWKNQFGTSKGGKIYREYRANRADVNRKAFPFLEKGGMIEPEELEINGKKVKGFRMKNQPEAVVYVEPNDLHEGTFVIITEVEGYEPTEGFDDWFAQENAALEVAKMIAEDDPNLQYATGGEIKVHTKSMLGALKDIYDIQKTRRGPISIKESIWNKNMDKLVRNEYIIKHHNKEEKVFDVSITAKGLKVLQSEKMLREGGENPIALYNVYSRRVDGIEGEDETHIFDEAELIDFANNQDEYGRWDAGTSIDNVQDAITELEKFDFVVVKRNSAGGSNGNVFVVDSYEERGTWTIDVSDPHTDKTIWDYRFEGMEDESSLIDDGYMKHMHDLKGLRKYLVDMGVISEDDKLINRNDFDYSSLKMEDEDTDEQNEEFEEGGLTPDLKLYNVVFAKTQDGQPTNDTLTTEVVANNEEAAKEETIKKLGFPVEILSVSEAYKKGGQTKSKHAYFVVGFKDKQAPYYYKSGEGYKVDGTFNWEEAKAEQDKLLDSLQYGTAAIYRTSNKEKVSNAMAFARGGKLQNPPQSTSYSYRNDKGEKAKRAGWRYTHDGAKRLKVKESAPVSKEHLTKYAGKYFTTDDNRRERYIYNEKRKDKSDLYRRFPYLAEGGILEHPTILATVNFEAQGRDADNLPEHMSGKMELHLMKVDPKTYECVISSYHSSFDGLQGDALTEKVYDELNELLDDSSYEAQVKHINDLELDEDFYKKGGKLQNPPQSEAYNYRTDKGDKAKRVGWRYTHDGAKRLKVNENAKVSKEHLTKYAGKYFTTDDNRRERYIYNEKRKDKSDVSRKFPYLKEGGQISKKAWIDGPVELEDAIRMNSIYEGENEADAYTFARKYADGQTEDAGAYGQVAVRPDAQGKWHVVPKAVVEGSDFFLEGGKLDAPKSESNMVHWKKREDDLLGKYYYYAYSPKQGLIYATEEENFNSKGEVKDWSRVFLLSEDAHIGNERSLRQFEFTVAKTLGLDVAVVEKAMEKANHVEFKAGGQLQSASTYSKMIKDILVNLAVEDELPTDMGTLDETVFYPVVKQILEDGQGHGDADVYSNYIKDAVVKLAVDDKLPVDMNSLNESKFNGVVKNIITVSKKKYEAGGDVESAVGFDRVMYNYAVTYKQVLDDGRVSDIEHVKIISAYNPESAKVLAISKIAGNIQIVSVAQVNAKGGEFAHNPKPAYFGSGHNLSYSGTRTRFLQNDGELARQLEKAIRDLQYDNDAQAAGRRHAIYDCMIGIDYLLEIEDELVNGSEALDDDERKRATYQLMKINEQNSRAGKPLDMDLVQRHYDNILNYINRAPKKESGGEMEAKAGKVKVKVEHSTMIIENHVGYNAMQLSLIRELQRNYIGVETSEATFAFLKRELQERLVFDASVTDLEKEKVIDMISLNLLRQALGKEPRFQDGGETLEENEDIDWDKEAESAVGTDEWNRLTSVEKNQVIERLKRA